MKRYMKEEIEPKNKRPKTTDDLPLTKIQHFDSVPNDLEIIMLKFIISEMEKNWKRNWNNISLVSKHWNSIAWIAFQRTIPKDEKIVIFIQSCEKGWFHFINKFLTQDTTFDPSFANNWRRDRTEYVNIIKLLLQDKRYRFLSMADFGGSKENYAIRLASYFGYSDIVKLLLKDKRVNPRDLPEHKFRFHGDPKIQKMILEKFKGKTCICCD